MTTSPSQSTDASPDKQLTATDRWPKTHLMILGIIIIIIIIIIISYERQSNIIVKKLHGCNSRRL